MSRQQEQEWQHQNPALAFPLDSLYCSEEHWEEKKEEEEDGCSYLCYDEYSNSNGVVLKPPMMLLEEDMFWDQEELTSLSSKQELNPLCNKMEHEHLVFSARREAVEWMLEVHAYYGFCPLTGVLAVNYLDRFLSIFALRDDMPWVSQLVAVACLSLAAKVEEIEVPLLLDLQVAETRYLFKAEDIQRMELRVLSSLQWKMNPVTPLSFIDHFARRFGLGDSLCWDFLRKCENILLYVISDSRSTSYLPSVLATAVMLHVVNTIDPSLESEYQVQLSDILPISKDTLDACLEVVSDAVSRSYRHQSNNKRKFGSYSIPGSPDGVIDVCFSSDDDSWAVAGSSVSSSPQPLSKKIKASENELELMQGLNHPAADFL